MSYKQSDYILSVMGEDEDEDERAVSDWCNTNRMDVLCVCVFVP